MAIAMTGRKTGCAAIEIQKSNRVDFAHFGGIVWSMNVRAYSCRPHLICTGSARRPLSPFGQSLNPASGFRALCFYEHRPVEAKNQGRLTTEIYMPYKKSQQVGGQGGDEFSDDLTQVVRIVRISIRHGARVDAIQTTWLLTDGTQLTGARHGGGGGEETVIEFGSNEHIVTIQGRSGSRIDSLTITTNKKSYGPYGGDGGKPFGPIPAEAAGGFFGRSGTNVDAIGVFIPA